MIQKNKSWMLISIGALGLSILSLFLPVVSYTSSQGSVHTFNLFKLLEGNDFVRYVLSEYTGDFMAGTSAGTAKLLLIALCLIGVAAIVLSGVGLSSMSKQYESAWPFRLTMAGILCTVIPAIAILVVVLMSGGNFYGKIQAGAYSYITPIAMVISCVSVTKRHKLTQEEFRIQIEASAYIRPAGDLPQ